MSGEKKLGKDTRIWMKIDLHIHTSTGSDGALTIEEVFAEAVRTTLAATSE